MFVCLLLSDCWLVDGSLSSYPRNSQQPTHTSIRRFRLSIDPRLTISLWSSGTVDVMDCLKRFCAAEQLRGRERVLCDRCKRKQECEKQLMLYELPEVLCVHLKRFRYEAGWFGQKNRWVLLSASPLIERQSLLYRRYRTSISTIDYEGWEYGEESRYYV